MDELLKAIHLLSDPVKAKNLSRFFKTGRGEYGEGDRFLGIMVPGQRKIAKEFHARVTLNDVESLLHNPVHECRLIALLILMLQYNKADAARKKEIYLLYLRSTAFINNWDLVDLSAPRIVGEYLRLKDRSILSKLAHSKLLWERRIAILATFAFIKKGEYDDALAIAAVLVNDRHDLIQKAVGWMLREIGKKDQRREEEFLLRHYRTMPRTALRYAIERFDEEKRQFYLKK